MTTVLKRSGLTEEFDRKKIEDSLRNIGIDWFKAKEIAGGIEERAGMTTTDIRLALDKELKKINHGMSERYNNARRFTAKYSVKNAKGVARLSKDSIKAMKIKVGDSLEIKYRDRCQNMRIEKDDNSISHNEIVLNEKDMAVLGVMEGNRVLARKSN
jgi:formylmethanofuran dehydrogenase subunit D